MYLHFPSAPPLSIANRRERLDCIGQDGTTPVLFEHPAKAAQRAPARLPHLRKLQKSKSILLRETRSLPTIICKKPKIWVWAEWQLAQNLLHYPRFFDSGQALIQSIAFEE